MLVAIAAFAAMPRAAVAQDYPTRTVTILVPFAAGGGTDMIARAIAQKLEQRLGKTFVIENRPGAGTAIAAAAAAKAVPDGYTLMQATSGTMSMNPPSSKTCLTNRTRTSSRSLCRPVCRSFWPSVRRCRCRAWRT
jgi:tripartite-type tricarboxylate transporter receptor subunit TctC